MQSKNKLPNSIFSQRLQTQRSKAHKQRDEQIAHEFNNLWLVLHSQLEITSELIAPNNNRLNSSVHAIRLTIERGVAMTKRLVSRHQPDSKQVLDFNDVLRNFIPILEPSQRENCKLCLALSDGPLYVQADQVQIEQVLLNLCINAWDAMPFGGRLQISTTECVVERNTAESELLELKKGSYAKVSIEDQGVGIAASPISRVFQPNFSTKDKDNGSSGWGLVIVQQIVRNHKGDIHIAKSDEHGTQIDLYIPSTQAAIAQDRQTLVPC